MVDVPVIDRQISYTATGGENRFFVDWVVAAAAELVVTRTRDAATTTLSLDVDYTVENVGNERGSQVVLVAAAEADDVYAISSPSTVTDATTSEVLIYYLATHDGDWQTAKYYARGVGVRNDGSSYVCKVPHTSSALTEPGTGGAWASVWELVASVGAQGDPGADGNDGADGTNGTDGSDGADGIFAGTETIETSIADGDLISFQDVSASNAPKRITKANLVSGLGGGGAGFRRSLVINGDFGINQRVFGGGSLSSGVYGFDRWKASGGAASISRNASTGVVTLTSGTIEQVIELAAPGLAGLDVTLSVWDLSSGNLDYDVAGETGTITAGAGQQSATITLPGGATGNLSLKLTPSSGAVTFTKVKLEVGSTATPWEYRSVAEELLLCQRYYCKSFPLSQAPAATNATDNAYAAFDWNTANIATQGIMFPVEMRATPTMTFYPNHGTGVAIGNWAVLTSGYVTAPVSVANWLNNRQFVANLALSAHGLGGKGTFARGHFTAEAEL